MNKLFNLLLLLLTIFTITGCDDEAIKIPEYEPKWITVFEYTNYRTAGSRSEHSLRMDELIFLNGTAPPVCDPTNIIHSDEYGASGFDCTEKHCWTQKLYWDDSEVSAQYLLEKSFVTPYTLIKMGYDIDVHYWTPPVSYQVTKHMKFIDLEGSTKELKLYRRDDNGGGICLEILLEFEYQYNGYVYLYYGGECIPDEYALQVITEMKINGNDALLYEEFKGFGFTNALQAGLVTPEELAKIGINWREKTKLEDKR